MSSRTPSNRTLGIIVVALLVIGLLASFKSSATPMDRIRTAPIPTTCEAQTVPNELVECIKLLLPEGDTHSIQAVMNVLGRPAAKGLALQCPTNDAGEVTNESACVAYPSLLHLVAGTVVITVYTTSDPFNLIHLSINELKDAEAEAELRRRINSGEIPGYQKI